MTTGDDIRRLLEARAASTPVEARPAAAVLRHVRRRRARLLAPAMAFAVLVVAVVYGAASTTTGDGTSEPQAAPVPRVRVLRLTNEIDLGGHVVVAPAPANQARVAAADAVDSARDVSRDRPVVARHGEVVAGTWPVKPGTPVWVLSYEPACCPGAMRHAVVDARTSRYLGSIVAGNGD